MSRRPGAADGAGWIRNASSHPIPNASVFAGASKLRGAIIMTNRKCIHVR
jgi:hypothetical protein